MAINLHISDAQNESPAALRSAAHFLNCLAANQDGKPSEVKVLTQGVAVAPITQETLPANPGNGQGAPGASADSTPPPAASAQGGETTLDKNGLPWDERIHSSSKNLNADGTWRYLRGGDTDVRAKVEAELRAAIAAAPAITITGSTAGDDTVSDLSGQDAPTAVRQHLARNEAADAPPPPPPLDNAADAPPPPPPLATAPEDAPAAETMDVKTVFSRVSQLQKMDPNPLPADTLTEVLELAGVEPPTMGSFIKNKHLAQAVWDALDAIVGEV